MDHYHMDSLERGIVDADLYPRFHTDHEEDEFFQPPAPMPSHTARSANDLGMWIGKTGRLRGRFPAVIEVIDSLNHFGAVKLMVRLKDHRQEDPPQWVMSTSIEWAFKTRA